MNSAFLSALGNHLWQSTLFAAVVCLFAFALKKNRAAVRYRLWVAASVKFLIPFSLLIGLGRQAEWPTRRVEAPAALVSAVENFSAPFAISPSVAQQPLTQPSPPALPMTAFESAATPVSRLPMIALWLWLCGAVIVVFLWLREWQRMRVSLKAAAPVDLKLPRIPIPVLMTAAPSEPGIVGIVRPALLLPKGILDRLSAPQLEAILTHELCHVRRRDNLMAAVHMLVETVFWFHPLIWWMERRLVEERERACDEEVLHQGGSPEAYAEGILNVCKLYRESALVCVSGVAGADLKKRIEDIMGNRVAQSLSFSRMALLTAAGIAALLGPVAIGIVHATASQATAAYTYTTLDVPGSSLTVASGIDALGRIAGYFTDSRGTHGFLASGGGVSTIDYPGAAWTAAYGVNAAGQVVGAYGPDEASGRHGFLLGGGNFSSFDVPGSTDTVARGVNNRGQIVGDYLGPDGIRHGFLLSGGSYSTIELPGSGGGIAAGINDAGQIAGLAGSGAGARGFLFSGGSYAAIQFPDSSYTDVSGLNNLGDVVGQADGPQPPFRGYRRSGGSFTMIDVPDYPSSWAARGINDLGQIVGAFTTRDGVVHGYRATPAALRLSPADSQGLTHLTDAPGTNGAAGVANSTTAPSTEIPGPASARSDTVPPLTGAAILDLINAAKAKSDAEPPAAVVTKALNATHNRLEAAFSTLQKTVPYRQGNEMGILLEKPVGDIAMAMNNVNAALAYIRDHADAAGLAAPATTPVEFEAPVPGGNAGPLVPPGVQVALNNLKAAFDTLSRTPGGDLGGLRDGINKGIAAASSDIFASLKDANYTTARGGRRGAPPATSVP